MINFDGSGPRNSLGRRENSRQFSGFPELLYAIFRARISCVLAKYRLSKMLAVQPNFVVGDAARRRCQPPAAPVADRSSFYWPAVIDPAELDLEFVAVDAGVTQLGLSELRLGGAAGVFREPVPQSLAAGLLVHDPFSCPSSNHGAENAGHQLHPG